MTGVSEALTAPDALTALISRLREALEKATPGPWRVFRLLPGTNEVCKADNYASGGVCGPHKSDDADLIVEMRNGLPLLLEALSATDNRAPMDVDALASVYAGEYVMSTEGADYEPTDHERALIEDALHGFLSDHRLQPATVADNRAPVEDGWHLVPVNPTEAMCEAASCQAQKPTGWHAVYPSIWRAFLAAAPTPPTGSETGA